MASLVREASLALIPNFEPVSYEYKDFIYYINHKSKELVKINPQGDVQAKFLIENIGRSSFMIRNDFILLHTPYNDESSVTLFDTNLTVINRTNLNIYSACHGMALGDTVTHGTCIINTGVGDTAYIISLVDDMIKSDAVKVLYLNEYISVVSMNRHNPLCPKYCFRFHTNWTEFINLCPNYAIEYMCEDFIIVSFISVASLRFRVLSADGSETLKILYGPITVKIEDSLDFGGLKFSD